MKRLAISLLLLLAACGHDKSGKNYNKRDTVAITRDTDSSAPAATTADPVVFIRQNVERINTSNLSNKHFEFMCDEKTSVDYSYVNNQPVKISIDYGWLGDAHAKEDYYFNNGQLIFFYEFVEGGPACEDCIKTNEYRSYIVDNRVIKYLKNKSEEKCKRCEFGSVSKPYKLLTTNTADEVKKAICN